MSEMSQKAVIGCLPRIQRVIFESGKTVLSFLVFQMMCNVLNHAAAKFDWGSMFV